MVDWKQEWKKLLAVVAVFGVFFWLPVGWDRFAWGVSEALQLARWYAREHVLLCLAPAFFIAGARGGAFWALLLGILFAFSFCPVSASLFFGGLIGLSSQHSSPVLLPTLFGIGTAVPVVIFAFIIAFASRYVGKAFNALTKFERVFRVVTGAVFIAAGMYYTLTHIYGLSVVG